MALEMAEGQRGAKRRKWLLTAYCYNYGILFSRLAAHHHLTYRFAPFLI